MLTTGRLVSWSRSLVPRLLLGEPSLLLLDEPTNHLDSSAKNWLMGFLSMYPGTVLLVSHEESLLRDFRCTAVAEVRDQELHVFRCVTPTFPDVTKTSNDTGKDELCCGITNENFLIEDGMVGVGGWGADDCGFCGCRCEYDKFVLQRVEREEAARRAFEAQQREIAKLQGYIDRCVQLS